MILRKIFAAALLLLSVGTAMAQQMPPIPVDKNVKIGHLDNGLTYYIRHNSYPDRGFRKRNDLDSLWHRHHHDSNHPVPTTMTRISDPLVWKGDR